VPSKEEEGTKDAFLAQFYTAEYSVFMGRVSSWENLQYAAWPILIGALAFLAQVKDLPIDFWWAVVLLTLTVYVAYQGTMVNMLYSVLFIERELRPLAGKLVGTQNFWIYERIRNKTFPKNPAWAPIWPVVISFSAIVAVAGWRSYKWYKDGPNWGDAVCLLISLLLGVIIVLLTRTGKRLKKDIIEACIPEVKPVEKHP